MSLLSRILDDIRLLRSLPEVTISLKVSKTADNDVFFERMVRRFYKITTRRHPRFPLVKYMRYGIALYPIPETAESYFDVIESSARRNVRKAQRLGYSFSRIDFNQHRQEIAEIIRSTPVRQGPMPNHMMHGEVGPISDPPSQSTFHDYFYVGVSTAGQLRAYASCMVAGDLIAITDIYGHHKYQPDGIVPFMIVEIVRYARAQFPNVRYCMYDKYFGAGDSMRRFKRKFQFLPYKVKWELD